MNKRIDRLSQRVLGALSLALVFAAVALAGQNGSARQGASVPDPNSSQPQNGYPRVLNQGPQDPMALLDQLFADPFFNDPFVGDPFGGDPFEEMRRMRAQMNQLFSQNFGYTGLNPAPNGLLGAMPSLTDLSMGLGTAEVTDNGDNYIVTAPIDDSKKANFNVRVDGSRLTITSTGSSQQTSTDDKGNTMQSESHGEYSQTISLPGPVDQSKMKIDQESGVLKITLPKSGAPNNTTSPSPLHRTSPLRQLKTT